jgi:hypothetical protein
MLSETLRNALLDIRDNIMLAQAFVYGLNYKQFKVSRLHFTPQRARSKSFQKQAVV